MDKWLANGDSFSRNTWRELLRLSTTDASFLYMESASGPMHISSINILEGEIAFEDVFAHFEERMHLLPAYRRKLAQVPFNIAHPTWVDDPDFDLANHLIHHQLPAGTTLDEAMDAAVQLNVPMMDRNKPLWMAYVITGVADATLILHATHHCMIDGASGVELLAIIYDFDPQGDPVKPAKDAWTPQTPPSATERFNEALSENLEDLSQFNWSQMFNTSADQRALMQRATKVVSDFVTKPVITAPFNAGFVGPQRRLAWMKQSFSEIREIRRALGGTINDVVLTVVSEAVAQYLKDHGENTTDQHMRIMCPVNVRTESQQGALGNQVSAIFPVLPAWPMPPAQRLSAVCAETEKIKQNQEAQALTLLQESAPEPWPVALWPTQLVGTAYDPTALAARVPLPVLPQGIRPPNIGYNFTCTNVPGAQVPQYLCGHRILDQVGLLILTGNVGFSVTILSYNKTLFFGFICEPRLLPDIEKINTAAQATFDALLEKARERTASLQEQN
jgi:diacylglycerol O-acyltransferase / wax synthase